MTSLAAWGVQRPARQVQRQVQAGDAAGESAACAVMMKADISKPPPPMVSRMGDSDVTAASSPHNAAPSSSPGKSDAPHVRRATLVGCESSAGPLICNVELAIKGTATACTPID